VPGVDGQTISVTTVQLEVDEGAGSLAWQQVDDFFASGPADAHFVLNRTTAQINFGDGSHGRIPVANPASPTSNIVARFYRFGGGAVANVGAGSVQSLQSSIPGVDTATNLQPALGGSNEETLDSAKLRAPQELKSKNRAVTSDDFEYIAEQTPGVRIRRAKALPLHHPSYPDVPIPGVVTVIVVPESDAPNPIAGAATLAIVCAELNQHRLLTSEVYVVAATYRLVLVEATLVVAPNADLSVVKKAVEASLSAFFHPLTGGTDGQGWPFGETIFYSDVYRRILDVDGVLRIQDNQLVLWLDNQRQQFCRDVPIQPGELLYSTGQQLSVTYQASA
jgi:predicted phage baseplate assembly protein